MSSSPGPTTPSTPRSRTTYQGNQAEYKAKERNIKDWLLDFVKNRAPPDDPNELTKLIKPYGGARDPGWTSTSNYFRRTASSANCDLSGIHYLIKELKTAIAKRNANRKFSSTPIDEGHSEWEFCLRLMEIDFNRAAREYFVESHQLFIEEDDMVAGPSTAAHEQMVGNETANNTETLGSNRTEVKLGEQVQGVEGQEQERNKAGDIDLTKVYSEWKDSEDHRSKQSDQGHLQQEQTESEKVVQQHGKEHPKEQEKRKEKRRKREEGKTKLFMSKEDVDRQKRTKHKNQQTKRQRTRKREQGEAMEAECRRKHWERRRKQWEARRWVFECGCFCIDVAAALIWMFYCFLKDT